MARTYTRKKIATYPAGDINTSTTTQVLVTTRIIIGVTIDHHTIMLYQYVILPVPGIYMYESPTNRLSVQTHPLLRTANALTFSQFCSQTAVLQHTLSQLLSPHWPRQYVEVSGQKAGQLICLIEQLGTDSHPLVLTLNRHLIILKPNIV